jgi:hypothetical protein
MAGRLEERMDQRNEAADMMQDRCNGFSGQALHHLNASESVPTIASPALVAFYTARGSLGACVSCQRMWGRMGEGRGCDWRREKRSDSRRITFTKMAAEIAPVERVFSTFDALTFKDGLAS